MKRGVGFVWNVKITSYIILDLSLNPIWEGGNVEWDCGQLEGID
jgi:hypothetical protein